MNWRHQFEGVLCATLLLAGILLVVVRTLGASAAIGSDQVQRVNANTTSWPKRPKLISRSWQPTPELESPTDVGSLWDQGPVYDLARDDLDY
jgi:hypothetical protein